MWTMPPPYNGYNPAGYNAPSAPAQQTIKEITPTQPSIECYSVSSPDDMKSINIVPGTVYIGLAKDNSAVYVRKFFDDGKIGQDTFVKSSVEKEKSELQIITEHLNKIEEKLNKWDLPDGTTAG